MVKYPKVDDSEPFPGEEPGMPRERNPIKVKTLGKVAGTPPLPIEKLEDTPAVQPDVFLLYGEAKTSKTIMASTFPAPLRFIDCDDGWKSIKWAIREGICPHPASAFERMVPSDEIDDNGYVTKPTGWWQVLDAINYWISDEHIDEWTTLVIDPLTTLKEFALNASVVVTGKHPSVQQPFSQTKKMSDQANVLLVGIQDYRPAQGFIGNLIRKIRKVALQHKKFVVFTCHVYEKTRASGVIGEPPTVIGYEPSLYGQQRKEITKDIDEIYYMKTSGSKDDLKYEVQTKKSGLVIAGSRYGCLDAIEPANFQEIMKKVEDYYGEKFLPS